MVTTSIGVGSETVTVCADAVEFANPAPPVNAAVTDFVPAEAKACDSVAAPPDTVTGAPTGVPSTENCTVP